MVMKQKIFLLLLFSAMYFTKTFAQTSFYGTVGIGKTEIKKFGKGLGNTFNPSFYQDY